MGIQISFTKMVTNARVTEVDTSVWVQESLGLRRNSNQSARICLVNVERCAAQVARAMRHCHAEVPLTRRAAATFNLSRSALPRIFRFPLHATNSIDEGEKKQLQPFDIHISGPRKDAAHCPGCPTELKPYIGFADRFTYKHWLA